MDILTPPAQVPPKPETPPVVTPPVVTPPVVVPPVVTPPVVPPKEEPKPPETPPARVVPETYTLKLPEGSKLDAAHLQTVSEFSKKNGLTQTEAQAILERDNAIQTAQAQKTDQTVKAVIEGWKTTSTADKEIGGDNLARNVELGKRVLDKFGPELKKLLDETGYGNHPDVIRTFKRLGEAMSEDQLVAAPTQSGGKKSLEEIMYGKPEETPKT